MARRSGNRRRRAYPRNGSNAPALFGVGLGVLALVGVGLFLTNAPGSGAKEASSKAPQKSRAKKPKKREEEAVPEAKPNMLSDAEIIEARAKERLDKWAESFAVAGLKASDAEIKQAFNMYKKVARLELKLARQIKRLGEQMGSSKQDMDNVLNIRIREAQGGFPCSDKLIRGDLERQRFISNERERVNKLVK